MKMLKKKIKRNKRKTKKNILKNNNKNDNKIFNKNIPIVEQIKNEIGDKEFNKLIKNDKNTYQKENKGSKEENDNKDDLDFKPKDNFIVFHE